MSLLRTECPITSTVQTYDTVRCDSSHATCECGIANSHFSPCQLACLAVERSIYPREYHHRLYFDPPLPPAQCDTLHYGPGAADTDPVPVIDSAAGAARRSCAHYARRATPPRLQCRSNQRPVEDAEQVCGKSRPIMFTPLLNVK
jgi:hypothetical protein